MLEDGQRVGGTLIGEPPFSSRRAALRWVRRERAGYEEDLALGRLDMIARAKFIRQTDPELYMRVKEINDRFDNEESNELDQAHIAAGTYGWLIKFTTIGLEAEGMLQRDAEGRMSVTEKGRRRAINDARRN